MENAHHNEDQYTIHCINTTQGSLIHYLYSFICYNDNAFQLTTIYLSSIICTYIPTLIAAFVGPNSIIYRDDGVLRLPFLYDFGFAFMAFVSFPCLFVLLVSDQHVLECALINVERDGVLVMSEKARQQLVERWKPLFLTINLVTQAVGLLVGLAIVYLNWTAVKQAPTWQVNNGQFVIAGYLYLYCVFIFYSAIAVYSLRVVTLSFFLRDIATYADLYMLPLHPDGSGGLRPIGHLGLRNQYLLSVTSINIILVFFIFRIQFPSTPIHSIPISVIIMGVGIIVAYLILGPVVFLGPLLPFRRVMLRNKAQLMSEVAQRIRLELGRIRKKLPSELITREDEELVERLRRFSSVIGELPVWPFDIGTLARFLGAYIVPVLALLGSVAIETLIKGVLERWVP